MRWIRMSEELGRLTYFDIEKMGVYNFNGGEPDPNYSPEFFLTKLMKWVNSNTFENTLPIKSDNRLRKKVYCKNIYKCPESGDFFFVLWKSEEDGNGNIQGVEASSPVDESSDGVALLTSDGKSGKKYIWGKPCYYWYITELNKFAAIRFPHSSVDTYSFVSYVRDFVNYRMKFEGKKITPIKQKSVAGKDFTFNKVTFLSHDNESRAQFLFNSKMFMKKAARETIQQLRANITHLVYRDTIGASGTDGRALLTKIFDVIPAMKKDKPKLTKEKRIELVVEETPSESELNDIIDFYDNGYAVGSTWNNIGFREGGKSSSTKWFDEYVLRDSFKMAYSAADKKHISARMLANTINNQRDRLIIGLEEVLDDGTKESANDDHNPVKAGVS